MTATQLQVLADFAEEVGATGAVAVRGAGTRFEVGGPLAPGTRMISAPIGISSYQPEEMTVTVLAGTSVAELHVVLAAAGQRSPLPERGGTVGGALAIGEDHVCSLGRGKMRGALLQVRYVSADGRPIKGGAPTVKNVSGFDLPRLIVGSLGTLGLIAEAILRTRPSPEVARWWSSADADPFVVREHVRGASAIFFDGDSTNVELEGYRVDVAADEGRLRRIGHWEESGGPPVLPPHRWSLRPSDLRSVPIAATGRYVAAIGVGTLFAQRAQPPRDVPNGVRSIVGRLKKEFDPVGRLSPGRDLFGAR